MSIAVSAAPPLLSDSLRVLVEEVADVTVVLDDPVPARVFDLAIVTSESPQPAAELTVVLDSRPYTRGGGLVRGARASGVSYLSNVSELLGFIQELAGRSGFR